jgi:hypothetical protein
MRQGSGEGSGRIGRRLEGEVAGDAPASVGLEAEEVHDRLAVATEPSMPGPETSTVQVRRTTA